MLIAETFIQQFLPFRDKLKKKLIALGFSTELEQIKFPR